MPIRAERRALYPPGWRLISEAVRFGRARGRCEWLGCAAVHGQPHPLTGSPVVLTTAHVWSADPRDVRPGNLMALCQLHHLALDRASHVANGRRRRLARRAMADLYDAGQGVAEPKPGAIAFHDAGR